MTKFSVDIPNSLVKLLKLTQFKRSKYDSKEFKHIGHPGIHNFWFPTIIPKFEYYEV